MCDVCMYAYIHVCMYARRLHGCDVVVVVHTAMKLLSEQQG
jgi:hypothetical protein